MQQNNIEELKRDVSREVSHDGVPRDLVQSLIQAFEKEIDILKQANFNLNFRVNKRNNEISSLKQQLEELDTIGRHYREAIESLKLQLSQSVKNEKVK